MSAVALAAETRVTARLLNLAEYRTLDAIAARLVELGDVGGHSVFDCPLSTFVRREVGVTVVVANSWWRFIDPFAAPRVLPAPLAAFVRNYDMGCYPELESASAS